MRTLLVAAAALVVATALAGCREEEQGRQLHLDKGTYSGPPDTGLTDEQLRALEQRTRLQQQ